MRQVLGDKKLNYLGISYGTYIGSVYAEEFPANVGHMVLDGAVDPNADQLEADVQQQIGFEKSLEKFASDCVTNYASQCPLTGDPAGAAKQLGTFIDGLQAHPLRTQDSNRPLDQTLGWTGVIIGLYGDVGSDWWKYLRDALSMAMKDDDGSELLAGADQYNGRDPKGHYSTEQDGLIAVRCADFTTPTPSASAVQSAYNQLEVRRADPQLQSGAERPGPAVVRELALPDHREAAPDQGPGLGHDPGHRHHRRPGHAVSERGEPGRTASPTRAC